MHDALLPFAVFFASIFTGNILLTNYLGTCSFLSVSKEMKTSVGLGIAVIFVMATTTPLNWLVYEYLLLPFGLEYLRFIVFIIVIAAFVQLTEMTIERYSEPLYQ
jgi:Na+-transporting NADH:ubiquinone oxidoreductase subunit E